MKNLILLAMAALTLNACSFGGVEDELKAQEERCEEMSGTYNGTVTTNRGPIESELQLSCRPTNNGTDSEGKTRVLSVMDAQVRLYDVLPQDVRLSVSEDKSGRITLMPFPKKTAAGESADASDEYSISFKGKREGGIITGTFLEGSSHYGYGKFKKSSSEFSSLSSDRWTTFLNCYEHQLNRVAGEYEAFTYSSVNESDSFEGPPAPRNITIRLEVEKASATSRFPKLRGYYVWSEDQLGASDRPLVVDLDARQTPIGITMTTPASLNTGANGHKLYVNIVGNFSDGVIIGTHSDWRTKKSYFKAVSKNWTPTPEKCSAFKKF